MNNRGLIKIGSTIDPTERQKRFNKVAKNRKNADMEIQKAVPLRFEGRAYEWAVESLLRYDLNTYQVTHKTMDTFEYNGAFFKPAAYIKNFEAKVRKAERILNKTATTGHRL
jgi:hypothetical protein